MEATSQGNEGYLDGIEKGSIFGWAWHAARPDEPISVDLYVDGKHEADVVARLYRQDLPIAGKGNGMHAFEIRLPDRYHDGHTHVIRLCYHGTEVDLTGSPRVVSVGVRTEGGFDRSRRNEGLHLTRAFALGIKAVLPASRKCPWFLVPASAGISMKR